MRRRLPSNGLKRTCTVLWAAALIALLAGCPRPEKGPIEAGTAESLSAVLPQSIEIVEAFTRWGDLDEKPGLDGIELCVQALTPTGEAVQAAGTMLVELYAFRQASGDPKGERKEMWTLALLSEADQKAHWGRATRMYDFRLELSPEVRAVSAGEKYVLMVTHHSPLGVHHSDEMVLQVPLGGELVSGRR